MADQALLYIPVATVLAGQNFTAEAKFKDRSSGTAIAPSTVEFRIDDVTNAASPVKVLDWTSLTAGDSVSIEVAHSYSVILSAANASERKQITVTGDRGLTTECSDQKQWTVRALNLGA